MPAVLSVAAFVVRCVGRLFENGMLGRQRDDIVPVRWWNLATNTRPSRSTVAFATTSDARKFGADAMATAIKIAKAREMGKRSAQLGARSGTRGKQAVQYKLNGVEACTDVCNLIMTCSVAVL